MSEVGQRILEEVTSYYLTSGDFNGISANFLSKRIGQSWQDLRAELSELVSQDLVGILYSDVEINTHIVRLGFEAKEVQIDKLKTEELFHTCIYPLEKYLSTVVDRNDYQGQPYRLELALGSPQLAFRSFDLNILEQYRNDPRYSYKNDDIRGTITVNDNSLAQADQILLQHFGFSYDKDLNRAVAVFVYDLAELSPEHQQIWKARQLVGKYELHPDFYRNSILGEWGEKISIFDALLHEMWVINQMAQAMERPPLFRHDYGEYGENKPPKLGFLVRPTLEEFNSFVHLLDRMLSDNIDKEFFRNEIPTETELTREDGKIEVRQKGTLQLLDSWVRKFFRPTEWEPWDEAISTLKKVRKLRQKPAHAIDENQFDQAYFKKQRELIMQVYESVRLLRLIFANHPAVKRAGIGASAIVQEGKIWTY